MTDTLCLLRTEQNCTQTWKSPFLSHIKVLLFIFSLRCTAFLSLFSKVFSKSFNLPKFSFVVTTVPLCTDLEAFFVFCFLNPRLYYMSIGFRL